MESALHRLQRGQHILAQQRTRVALMEAAGSASPRSKQLLKQMEQAVAEFERHVQRLQLEEAEEEATPRSQRKS